MSKSTTGSISRDAAFDIMSNARRRYVLYLLRQNDGPLELSDVAEQLAAWENDTTVEELTKQQQKRVYVSLYQTHVQKLADADIIEYDSDAGMIALANGANNLNRHLSVEENESPRTRWEVYYVTLAAAGGILYTLAAFDISAFALLPEFWAGLTIVLAFVGLAIINYLKSGQEKAKLPIEALVEESD